MTLAGALPYLVAVWILLWGLWGAVTSRNLVHLVVCVAVIQSSTYLVLAAIGFKEGGVPPVFDASPPTRAAVDPVVQALMLTDIVVEATVVALLLALAIKAHERGGTVDPDAIDVLRG